MMVQGASKVFFFFIFPLATYHTAGISQQATPPYVIKERHL
jgi:hypothetical protein